MCAWQQVVRITPQGQKSYTTCAPKVLRVWELYAHVYSNRVSVTLCMVSNATPWGEVHIEEGDSLLQSLRLSHTVPNGSIPIFPTGTVSHYGKLDTCRAFVTVLPPLQCSLLIARHHEWVVLIPYRFISCWESCLSGKSEGVINMGDSLR